MVVVLLIKVVAKVYIILFLLAFILIKFLTKICIMIKPYLMVIALLVEEADTFL